jgi:FkbM family methyltransferase
LVICQQCTYSRPSATSRQDVDARADHTANLSRHIDASPSWVHPITWSGAHLIRWSVRELPASPVRQRLPRSILMKEKMGEHMSGYEKSAHLYDLFDHKEDIRFFDHYVIPGEGILDIGAGTGRIALPLAEKGVRVVCVEPSPAMRGQLRAKLAGPPDLNDNIEVVAASAASFDLKRTFPAAFLSGTYDHFLDDEERPVSLRNIARRLQPAGTLVFDVFLGLMDSSPLSPAGQVQRGNCTCRRFVGRRLLPGRKVEVTLVFEIHQDAELIKRTEQHSVAAITERDQVHQVLVKAGFSVRREFSRYDFTPYREGDESLIVEAVYQPHLEKGQSDAG